MSTNDVTCADIEGMIDRLALTHDYHDGKTSLHAAASAMNGVTGGEITCRATGEACEFGPLLLHALRKVLALRISDQKGFDVVVLKTLCPTMTHDQLAKAMSAMGSADWRRRASSREAIKRLVERFPALSAMLTFDRRGGDRRAKPTRKALATALAELAGTMPLTGPDGVYHALACRFSIRGRDGKPSTEAARKRLVRLDIVQSVRRASCTVTPAPIPGSRYC